MLQILKMFVKNQKQYARQCFKQRELHATVNVNQWALCAKTVGMTILVHAVNYKMMGVTVKNRVRYAVASLVSQLLFTPDFSHNILSFSFVNIFDIFLFLYLILKLTLAESTTTTTTTTVASTTTQEGNNINYPHYL